MGYFYKFIFLSGFLLFINIAMQSQNLESSYLRGDANVQFRWRVGYSEYPINRSSRTDLEDVTKGRYAWYDGLLWSGAYKDWQDRTIHGVSLLFRGGSPYARTIHFRLVDCFTINTFVRIDHRLSRYHYTDSPFIT